MKYLIVILFALLSITQTSTPRCHYHPQQSDDNINSNTSITKSDMIIYGEETNALLLQWILEGKNKSFSEYLAPAREKGLRCSNWKTIYGFTPSTKSHHSTLWSHAETIAHGSDLSYEDMMENRKLTKCMMPK